MYITFIVWNQTFLKRKNKWLKFKVDSGQSKFHSKEHKKEEMEILKYSPNLDYSGISIIAYRYSFWILI